MPRSSIILFVALLAACSSNAPAPVPPAEGSGAAMPEAAPPAPAMPAGSALLGGAFEYRTTHLGHDVHLGLRFTADEVTRLNQGVATATEPYTIEEDAPGRVVIEVRVPDEPAKRRELVFDGPDVLFDAAAPEVRYGRIAGPEGSGEPEPEPTPGG